jgi:hypothetical protein
MIASDHPSVTWKCYLAEYLMPDHASSSAKVEWRTVAD